MQTQAEWDTLVVPQRRFGKFIVRVYTRSERGHRPHVHVFTAGAEVVIVLSPDAEVRENPGAMRPADVRAAQRIVAAAYDELLDLWNSYNG